MSDLTRNYGITYTADGADSAAGQIRTLAAAVAAVDQYAGDSTNQVAALGRQAVQSAGQVATLGKALASLKGADLANLKAAAKIVGQVGDGLTFARQELENLKSGVAAMGPANREFQVMAGAVGRFSANAGAAATNVGNVNRAVDQLIGRQPGIDGAKGAMEGFQRKAYGAAKNVQDIGAALGQVEAKAAGLAGATQGVGDLASRAGAARREIRGAARASSSLGKGLRSAAAGLSLLEAARRGARAVGDAVNEARETRLTGAERAIELKDSLREVANLQGKAAPDDETVRRALRLRADAGLTAGDADAFQRRFYGSIAAGRDKGNIDARTAEAIQEVGSVAGVRTGIDVGTAGDLTASLANYAKVPGASSAAGQVQTIIDRLNEGRGDLTPLAQSLLKTAGSTVGKGMPFRDLPELAATIGVASNNASPAAAGTMVRQAQRALFGFNAKQGDTLRTLGIAPTDDFMAAVDKIAPLVEKSTAAGRNPMADLAGYGFGNLTDRQAITFFAQNRELLRSRLALTRGAAGADGSYSGAGERAIELNRAFLRSDTARDRISRARLDMAEWERYGGDALLQTRRREAEASMRATGQIDTPASNIVDTTRDLFGLVPSLGFRSSRQRRIDDRAGAIERGDALTAGVAAPIPAAAGAVAIPRALPATTDVPTVDEAKEAARTQKEILGELRKGNAQRARQLGQAPAPLMNKPRVDPIR